MELSVRNGHFVWDLLPLDPGTEIAGFRRLRTVDCVDLAARPGEFAEGQGVALVDHLLRDSCSGALLRGISLPRQHLADRAGRYRLVLLWPEHGGKDRDPG